MRTTGGCLCGAVRYEARGAPLNVAHCHCGMCRKHSGAAFLTYALYAAESVAFTGSLPTQFRSSAIARRSHCGTCGSPIGFIYDANPGRIYLTVGTMDDPGALHPREHWHMASKVAWLPIHDDLPSTDEMPPGGG